MTATGNGIRCPICGGLGVHLRSLFDDRYGFPGFFPLCACPNCEHKFLAAEFTSGQIEDLYTRYYPRKDMSPDSCRLPRDSTTLLAWLEGEKRSAYRWVERNVRVLDIGCGSCESLLYHRHRGCDAHGVEADRNVMPIVERFELKVFIGAFDPAQYAADYFDYVTMDQVIEHFPDPLQLLLQVKKILRPGGRLVFSTPNGRGWGQRIFGGRWLHWHAPYHLQHFSSKSIGIAADKTGFRVLKCATITSSHWLHMQWTHLLNYPAPGLPSAYWTKALRPGFGPALRWFALGVIHRLKLNHLITRLLDMAGIGDNHLVIFEKVAE